MSSLLRRILLALATAFLLALSLPQSFPWWTHAEIDPRGWLELLAWFALVPLLHALDATPRNRTVLLISFLSGFAYFMGAIWWVSHAMTAFGGLPLWLSLLALSLLVGYMAAHWAAALLLAAWLRRRLGWGWALVLPPCWTALEWLRNYLFTGFPWGNLGYTQARTLPVAQLAAALGVYGVAALVALVNGALADALRARAEGARQPRRALVVAGLALLLTVAGGALHLSALRGRIAAAPKLTVALVQPNVNQAVKNQRMTYADFILGRLVPLTVEGDLRGADLVAWPEAAYPYSLPPDIRSLADPRSGLPPLRHAHLLLGAATYERRVGADGRAESESSNSVFLLRPDLTVMDRYQKNHLVPFGEYVPLRRWLPFLDSVVPQFAPQRPGAGLRVLAFPAADGGAVRLAPMICFDAIFPEIDVRYAEQDPEILVNPTNDAWYGYSSGPHQFLAMVRMRAVESGKAVARPAYAGVTALILPTGEVLPGALPVGPVDPELAPDPHEPPRLLLGALPRLRGPTLYTRFGDLFAGLCAAGAAAMAAWAWRARRRSQG
jgi:apolipoprotein N-acyltransferase